MHTDIALVAHIFYVILISSPADKQLLRIMGIMLYVFFLSCVYSCDVQSKSFCSRIFLFEMVPFVVSVESFVESFVLKRQTLSHWLEVLSKIIFKINRCNFLHGCEICEM